MISPYTTEVTKPREPVSRDTFLDEGRVVASLQAICSPEPSRPFAAVWLRRLLYGLGGRSRRSRAMTAALPQARIAATARSRTPLDRQPWRSHDDQDPRSR